MKTAPMQGMAFAAWLLLLALGGFAGCGGDDGVGHEGDKVS